MAKKPFWPWTPTEEELETLYNDLEVRLHQCPYGLSKEDFIELLLDAGPYETYITVAERIDYYVRYKTVPPKGSGLWDEPPSFVPPVVSGFGSLLLSDTNDFDWLPHAGSV
jgi:hypothetical protein